MYIDTSHIEQLPSIPEDELSSRYKSRIRLIRKAFLSRLNLCLGLIDGGKKFVLDVGIGSGILLPSLSRFYDFAVGLDIHNNLSYVKSYLEKINIQNVYVIRADIHYLPFKDDVFDDVLSVSVLDHLQHPSRAVDEVRRVMVKGGTAVFGFHVDSSVNQILHFFFTLYSWIRRDLRNFWEHVFEHIHTDKEIVEILSQKLVIKEIRNLKAIAPVYVAVKCNRV